MSQFHETINSREWVLVAWTADWCVACKGMHHVLQDITDMYQDRLSVFPADIKDYQTEANEYFVRGLPRYSLFHKGKHMYSVSGTKTVKEMSEWLMESMAKGSGNGIDEDDDD